MKAPKKLDKADLKHPKDLKSSFNGDKIRSKTYQGFMRAGRVTTTEGTRPPTNVKPVDLPSIDSVSTPRSRDITGCRPVPAGHRFTPAFQRDIDLTAQQISQLTPNQRKRHKNQSTK
jgi:hypothetical protein